MRYFKQIIVVLFTIIYIPLALNAKEMFDREASSQPDMVYISAGEFIMGSDKGDSDEQPKHIVYLDGYYIDKYEVTFTQYDKFCEATGRIKPGDEGWGRGDIPVVNVSWEDANSYCQWVGKRLPTEAEWEKAAKAGSNADYCFGDLKSELSKYAWYKSNSDERLHRVGQRKPNQWGIYDMYGNVWEWCRDWYDKDWYKQSPKQNPQGPGFGIVKAIRGGSFTSWVEHHPLEYSCRSANRYADVISAKYADYGFRCVKNE